MFQDAYVNGSTYCGPTSLSAVTGVGTKELCAIIRSKFPYIKVVKGVSVDTMISMLDHFGLEYTKPSKAFKPCNLRTWLRDYRARDTTYILNLTGHYVVVRNDEIICTQFNGKITPICQSKYLGTRVKRYYVIESEPKEVIIPVARRKSQYRTDKTKVLNLCKANGIEIDHEEHDRDSDLAIWMWLPDRIINDKFGGVDPWDGDHVCYDYPDALCRLKDVLNL